MMESFLLHCGMGACIGLALIAVCEAIRYLQRTDNAFPDEDSSTEEQSYNDHDYIN